MINLVKEKTKVGVQNRKRLEEPTQFLCGSFSAGAKIARADELLVCLMQEWPPKVSGNKLVGLACSGVAYKQ